MHNSAARKVSAVFLILLISGASSVFAATVQPPPLGKLVDAICTYDPSGTAWSDPFPTTRGSVPTCAERVGEIHNLLAHAPEAGPWVLVGYSIGGLYARLYAATYPKEVGAMVLIDHAFLETGEGAKAADRASAANTDPETTPPVLISQTPVAIGIEDDRNFNNLPRLNRQLHAWAMSANPALPTPQMAAECFDAVAKANAESPTTARPYAAGRRQHAERFPQI